MATKKSRYIPQTDKKLARLSKAELNALVALKRKRGRREAGLFLAEGVRLLEEALKFKRQPERLFVYPPDVSERGERLLASFRARHAVVQTVSSRDFHRLVDTEQSQGILGVFRLPKVKFDRRQSKSYRHILVAENINDPGNLGSLIRSALGFGFSPVALVGDCVEPFNPKVVRASAGSVFGVEIYEMSYQDLKDVKTSSGATLLVTDLRGEAESGWMKPKESSKPLLLAVCSESAGASSELIALADRRIRISHSSALESLNAAFAGAIAMHHIYLTGADPAEGGSDKV